jgi:hypothetical protein
VTGSSGTFSALAATSLLRGQLVQSVSASAGGVVDGASTAQANAAIATATAGFSTLDQAIATVTGAPTAPSISAVFGSNGVIKAAFGAKPVVFAIGELGGAFSSGGASAQTTYSEIDEAVDLTRLGARQNLVLGLYKGVSLGAGVTCVTFDLYVDGADVLSKSFANGAAAQAWFADNAITVGSLAAGSALVGASSVLTLKAVLTVTTDTAGSGFFGDLIIGDPPASAIGSMPHQLAQAMSSLRGASAAPMSPAPPASRFTLPTLVTPGHGAMV